MLAICVGRVSQVLRVAWRDVGAGGAGRVGRGEGCGGDARPRGEAVVVVVAQVF